MDGPASCAEPVDGFRALCKFRAPEVPRVAPLSRVSIMRLPPRHEQRKVDMSLSTFYETVQIRTR